MVDLNDKNKLKQSRKSIEKITIEILDLLSQRLELGREVAVLKNNLNLPLVDPAQEQRLYKSIQKESESLNLNKNFSKNNPLEPVKDYSDSRETMRAFLRSPTPMERDWQL